MVIIICFFIALITTCVTMCIYEVVSNKVRIVRENKAFANLPKKVLLTYALKNPVYSSQYYHMRLIMSQDRAANHAIKNMLIDRKILKYRKEEL